VRGIAKRYVGSPSEWSMDDYGVQGKEEINRVRDSEAKDATSTAGLIGRPAA
jgi:hypothetical protein